MSTLCFYHIAGKWWVQGRPHHPTRRESPQPCVCSPAGCSSAEPSPSAPLAATSAREKQLGKISLKKI